MFSKPTPCLLALFGSCLCVCQSFAETDRPNIVFFLVDDLGWTDINGFEGPESQRYDNPGGEHDNRFYYTPRIAQLRNEGMRFTNAYASCPFCGPSRASILTGKYPARIGFTNNNTHDQNQGSGPFQSREMIFTEPVEPDLVRNLDPQTETSIARALKAIPETDSDYLSCAIGKWHVYSEGITGYGPEAHGFDFNIGGSFRGQPAGSSRPGWDFYRGHGWSEVYYPNLENPHESYPNDWPKDLSSLADFENQTYLTDALTHRALEFIELAHRQSQPFFLYLSHYGVHSPMQAKRVDANGDGQLTPDDPEVHADLFKARRGRDDRHEIEPPPGSKPFHTPYTYASMVKSIDESLGQIRDALETYGIIDNTIIIFYSDNGGVERNRYTGNHPLRSDKTHAYEGGVRVPLIIRGPDIAANTTCAVPVTGPDFFPTLLELAEIGWDAIEKDSLGKFSRTEIDGTSLVPLLRGTVAEFHRENDPTTPSDDGAIYWHVPHYKHSAPFSALRKNNYKFIRYWEDNDNLKNRNITEDGYFMSDKELYDLTRKIGESGDENLYSNVSALARDLEFTLLAWLQRVDAKMPTAVRRDNPNGATQAWYSEWIAKNDSSKPYTDPVKEAIRDSSPGDTILVYPESVNETARLPNIPKGVTIKSIHD